MQSGTPSIADGVGDTDGSDGSRHDWKTRVVLGVVISANP